VRGLAIIVSCFLLGGLARPESVTVEARKPQESSRHVPIVVMLGGKPVSGVTVDYYPIAAEPHYSAVTDQDGVATKPDLAVGDYNIIARLDEDVSTSLYLHVISKKTVSTFSMDLTEAYAQAQRAQQAAESLPIRDRIQAFRGTVLDPTGAMIPGGQYPRGEKRLAGERCCSSSQIGRKGTVFRTTGRRLLYRIHFFAGVSHCHRSL